MSALECPADRALRELAPNVLDVYTRPHDPQRPLLCLDETSKQLVSETRTPLPMKPGQPERIDYEYERGGTANLFMLSPRWRVGCLLKVIYWS
jgi:hypothetical protein